jgi:hypothetical protein
MSVTDLDQLQEIQLTLQEDATFSNGLWSLAEVLGYFNQRQYRFLLETKILAAFETIEWIPGQEQMPLPIDWIVTISCNWHDEATEQTFPLPRTDRFEMDRLLGPTVVITPAMPMGYREEDTTETITIAVSPAPASTGSLNILYVSLSDLLDGTGVLFNIPDDFVPYIKYGVYADMLGKTGRGQDLLRARYSEQRYQEGIILTQSLLEGWP